MPKEPLVIPVIEEIGQYGGILDWCFTGVADMRGGMSYNLEPWVKWNDDASAWEPNLAKSVEVNPEGTEWTFTIREGHRWSDGEPFTTEDILFWYEDVVLNEELTPSVPAWFKTGGEVGTIEIIDDYTFKAKFAKPHGMLALQMAFVWGAPVGLENPKHYMQQFHPKYADKDELDAMVKEAGLENWTQLWANKIDLRLNPDIPTLRAHKLTTSEPPWIWERNPYYFKVDPEGNQLPYIDTLRAMAVEDKSMITMKAIAGELTYEARHVAFADLPLYMDNREKGNYRVVKDPSVGNGAMIYPNLNVVGNDKLKEILNDVRFRRAMNMAIDRDEMNELIYLSEYGDVRDLFDVVRDEEELFDFLVYDPDQAEALLDEMGMTKGTDGFRTYPDGSEFLMKIDVMAGMMDPLNLMANYLNQIGLNVNAEEISYDLWWPRINSHEYETAGYYMSDYPGLSRLIYMLWFVPVNSSTYWAPVWGQYYLTEGKEGEAPTGDAATMVELHDQILGTVDPGEQMAALQEILRLYLKNAFTVLSTGYGPAASVVRNDLHNVPDPANFSILKDNDKWQEQWFIREG